MYIYISFIYVQGASTTYTSVNQVTFGQGHALMVMQNKIRSRRMRKEKLNFTFWYSIKFKY